MNKQMQDGKYVNKVVFGSETIMDISDCNVSTSDVKNNITFYDKNGVKLNGTYTVPIYQSNTFTSNGTYSTPSGQYLNTVIVQVPTQTYYTGSGEPSSSLGSNGDLYFKE